MQVGACQLLWDHPITNLFACPWPAGVTEKCTKGSGSPGSPITDSDCHPTYRCDSTSGTLAHGTCVPDPLGTQTLDECYSSCKCVVPHNCGQLNGTVACGALLPGPNVCPACINAAFTQDQCDQCFAYPAPNGCGNKTSAVSAAAALF